MSDLCGNPKDKFSRAAAHMYFNVSFTNLSSIQFQEAERILEKIDTLHLEFAKRAAVSIL